VPEALNILEQFDLSDMGHNSPRYLHLLTEALKLGFADRYAYYGDPDFVRVPIRGLASKEYARRQAKRISLERATPGMPDPGDPWPEQGESGLVPAGLTTARPGSMRGDTSYLCVVDEAGNGFSCTPSDGVQETPVVPGVGSVLSSRGRQSWIEPGHASSIAPGKRPHLTPNPGVMLKDGRLAMVFGTPGGDVQSQAMVQFLTNMIDFGMEPQAAIEAPRVATFSFPSAFHPHAYHPGQLCIEGRMAESTVAALDALGHRVERWPDFTSSAGALSAIQCDGPWGPRATGADPRRLAYAIGW
jgi:gamma-glutamyltranspeptidase/glutathione hydrolase